MSVLSRSLKTNMYAWLLLLPSLIFLGLFTLYPIAQTIYVSFFQGGLGATERFFIGLQNYQQLQNDEVFWKVIKNTCWFAIGTVPTSIIIALGMALFVNKALIGNTWLRAMFFYPTIIPMIAVANIWLFIYTPDYGLLAQLLQSFGFPQINLLGQSSTVLLAMMIIAIWKEAGLIMIFYLAGLQNISKELYESAKMDGASSWQAFVNITFPLLMPTTMFVFIITFTNMFKLVDHIVIMTQGGPNNSSNLLLYYIYETAFKFWDQGMAAVLTVVLLTILVVLTAVYFFVVDKKVHYS
ncbi:carbohydrate ABC transporter permease [Halalkalibacter urbisdiaboli]|uniref:carbohydrate ABC transporter permease n=1 Tax=Halalkalibacter urbisdiaboli TaxID=1960589 RepID=UPI003CCA29F2